MNKIKLLFPIIKYYFILFIGVICLSLLIYFKFIRERLPKDIPMIMTEYRFWILCYISLLYLYIVISTLYPKSTNVFIKEIIKIVYIPLISLDHLIKYNKFTRIRYYTFMLKFLKYLKSLTNKTLVIIRFLFQILPRIILVTILLLDTFYFCKLEMLYKVLLVGIIPFIHRYIKHSLKDLKEHYVKELYKTHDCVCLADEAYADPNVEWVLSEENKYHDQFLTIEEYVEFRVKQLVYNTPKVQYDTQCVPTKDTCDTYTKIKYGIEDINLITKEDNEIIHKPYEELMPKILDLGVFLEEYDYIANKQIIQWSRIIIFSLYFTCWTFILIISYYFCPIDLVMTKYFFYNLSCYLTRIDDIFSSLDQHSRKRNRFTKDVIKSIVVNMIKKLQNETL